MNLDNTFSNFEQNDVKKSVFFLKVDETSISDRGSECWPHDLHRAAQCWSCPFGCVLSVPVCSSYTEAESSASSAAGCDREKASYPGRWAFFFLPFFDVSNGKQCRSMLVSIRVCQNRNDQNRDLVAMIWRFMGHGVALSQGLLH